MVANVFANGDFDDGGFAPTGRATDAGELVEGEPGETE